MRLSKVIAGLLAAGVALLAAGPTAARGGRVPSILPGHVAFGLANSPEAIGWLKESGVPVELRYQYLAGGVNTGKGWRTWGPDGSFVSSYARASRRLGTVAVFPYYMLLQSRPARGRGEGERLYNNLNDPETMRAYYEDFTLLVRRVGEAGGAIVHVEPDLFGFLQKDYAAGGRKGAGDIPAAVAATGIEELRDLPDTAHGFGRALLRLRNRYGPNVLLGIHASHWATGVDVGSSPDPDVDARDLGGRTARFLRGFGDGWDLVFVDPSDRDSAWKEAHWPGQRRHWWDLADRAYPNFARYRDWVDAVSTGLDLRVVVWQIPVGNTLYRTLDNTKGHYQDNRAQYFLEQREHVAEWARAGVVAFLFGAGIGGATDYLDSRRDGITNPPPINGNARESRYADDDGGYLREAITRYYREGPVALP
ncbi:MAG: hypothetical protein HY321_21595 [Armatimonadetes bacterium]|nr:hypothetical protein [Armatimonadota bacterium]